MPKKNNLNAVAIKLRAFMADVDLLINRVQLLREEISHQESLPKAQQKHPAYLKNAIRLKEIREVDLAIHAFLEAPFPEIAARWEVTLADEEVGPETILERLLLKKASLNHALSTIVAKSSQQGSATSGKSRVATHAFFDEPLDPAFKRNVFHKAPLLHYYSSDRTLKKTKPLAGLKVLLVLHFLRDLIPFMEGLVRLGLEPGNATLFYKEYRYPQKKAVSDWLRAKGFHVEPTESIPAVLARLASEPAGSPKLLLVEDGGFFVPAVQAKHKGLAARIVGAVEQTTRGIWNTQEALAKGRGKLAYPVLSIPASRLKQVFEPQYIGRAVVDNVQTLVDGNWTGATVALLGFGTIGQAIADSLRSRHARIVAVYDTNSERMLTAHQKGLPWVSSAADAVKDARFVIGCSGRNSVDSAVVARLRHDAYLVSASSEQYEIDVAELERSASGGVENLVIKNRIAGTDYVLAPDNRRIHLLADGYPVNFWGMNSMPDEASDVIMTLIFLAAVDLAAGEAFSPGIQDEAINQVAERHAVARRFLGLYQ